ncbi:hypothetical protein V8F33_005814 [Rhypophila sp. PSN 637]
MGGHSSRSDLNTIAGGGDGESGRGQTPYLTSLNRRHNCNTWQTDSYIPNGGPYFKSFDTMLVSGTFGPFPADRLFKSKYDQEIDVKITFDISAGDPLGSISASLSIPFGRAEVKDVHYAINIPAGKVARMGFTPGFVCTKGRLTDCDGKLSDETETCTPSLGSDGVVQGDYTLVL